VDANSKKENCQSHSNLFELIYLTMVFLTDKVTTMTLAIYIPLTRCKLNS
jgi:hypothetical protein